MRVVYKRPGKTPKLLDIDGRLETLQSLVGGNIEPITMSGAGNVVCLCDENGKIYGRQPNFTLRNDVIVGSAVFIGADGEDFTDIPEEDAVIIMALLSAQEEGLI